jgi:hypothetical protein
MEIHQSKGNIIFPGTVAGVMAVGAAAAEVWMLVEGAPGGGLVLILLGLGLALVPYYFFSLLSHQKVLTFGEEKLRLGMNTEVLYEIPYDNIAEVKMVMGGGGPNRFDLYLLDPSRDDTEIAPKKLYFNLFVVIPGTFPIEKVLEGFSYRMPGVAMSKKSAISLR